MGSTTMFQLGQLSQEECWSLFSRVAFSGRTSKECQSLEDIGMKVANKCQGLPLAAKVLGGLLRFKRSREQWQSVLDSEIWELEEAGKESSFNERGRHLMLKLKDKALSLDSICNVKALRTLLVESQSINNSVANAVLPQLLDQPKCLRAVDLSMPRFGCLIEELPKEIGKLTHLRYLNLSNHGDLQILPEVMCDLCNLQTLDITGCRKLEKLPHGIGKLINLRHLLNKGTQRLKFMPKGVEKLASLRTLMKFIVSADAIGNEISTLSDLKNLNQIRGCLEIRGLRNLTDVSEVEQAQLQNKKNLLVLELSFDSDWENFSGKKGEQRVKIDGKTLLEALQPPPFLEKLEIRHYRGPTVFPSWMISLTKLKSLDLSHCKNWKSLPPLGKLPSLESLRIRNMERVKKVGDEFLGLEGDQGQASSSFITAFPNLEHLRFEGLRSWKKWHYGIPSTSSREESVKIMPILSSLEIWGCIKLQSLPDHILQMTTLNKLYIHRSPILSERCRKDTGEYWPSIAHTPNIVINGEYIKREGQ
ncbi:Disease resistance protein [Corchorus olitorius]|uniref:Disease resistance protein n=1 Tax=Corchorus olitorius TaxID=93759 RepID=A0A1R3H7T0_9ROSI|nr:Disease resistance protein [Corchorus olitorius]